jgi:integrase
MSSITTKTGRRDLKPAKKAYFRTVAPGLALGYRRTVTGAGRWVVRRADGRGGNTVLNLMTSKAPIRPVVADDVDPANGFDVMDFAQAQVAAGGPSRSGDSFTVADAVAYYLKAKAAEGRNVQSSETKAEANILPTLGAVECADLTRERIRDWLADLAAKPLAGSKEPDPEVRAKRRRATANRNLTVLKAALNLCHRERKIASDTEWRKLKPLKNANTVRDRWLSKAEAQRLERACVGDFKTLAKAALLTGARYGQLCDVKVKDFDAASATLRLESAKGSSGETKEYRVFLNAEAVAFFTALCAGRNNASALILTNEGEAWKDGEQIRLMNTACDSAGIVPRIVFHGLRHTYASLSLQASKPMTLLELALNLGHADTKMVERTYGHLAAAHRREAASAAPSFGFEADSNVVGLR